MSNRFHNKFHRHNHHTRPTDRGGNYPDSAYDPIASPDAPFQGDFHLSGNFVGLSSVTVKGTLNAPVIEVGNLTIDNNLTVLGSTTILDTYVFCLSTVEVSTIGTGPALSVTQKGTGRIASFVDADGNKPIVFDTNGQVGIGTTTPDHLLTIVETGTLKDAELALQSSFAGSKLLLQSSSSHTEEIHFRDRNTVHASIVGNPLLSSLQINTNGSTRVTITSGGRVGIGTSAPNERLTIDQNVSFIGTNTHYIKSEFGTHGGLIVFGGTSTGLNSPVIHPFYSLSSYVGTGPISSDSSLDIILPYQERKIVYGTEHTTRYFLVSGDTTNNTAVAGDAYIGGIRSFAYTGSNRFATYGKGGNASIDLRTAGEQSLTNTGGYITFSTMPMNSADASATEKMRITSGGHVYIGSDAAKLKATTGIELGDTSALLNIHSKERALLLLTSESDEFNPNITLKGGNAPSVNFTVTNTGSAAPYVPFWQMMQVNKEGHQGYKQHTFTIRNVDTTGSISPSSFIAMLSSGEFGIGTKTPNEKLTVVGNISAAGWLNEIFSSDSDSILRTRSSFGNAIIHLDNAVGSTGTGPLINFQNNSRSFSRIRGNISLSALSIETENVERVRFSKDGTSIYGNLTIQGDLSSTGTQYFANTLFTTTSAISVVNISPLTNTPAFYIAQSGPGDIASFYDLDQGVEVLHVGGANGTFPNVGIKNSQPNKDFTVKGEISASGTIWDTVGNSELWNAVYSWVKASSATWQGIGQLAPNTVQVSALGTLQLSPVARDIEIIPASTIVTEITAFANGVKGITYTLTNKTAFPIVIQSSPNIIIRRGNAWISNTTTLSGAYLVLPLSGSCNLRADTNFVSLW